MKTGQTDIAFLYWNVKSDFQSEVVSLIFCIKQVSNWALQMACYMNLMPSICKVVRVIKMLTQNDNSWVSLNVYETFWSVLLTATASYRLLPEITITKPCEDNLADKLVRCSSEGVIKRWKTNTVCWNVLISEYLSLSKDLMNLSFTYYSSWLLTTNTNSPGGIINVVGERPATKCIQIS